MSERLFDALETCLQALEQGETIDAALARFPALAADLRPVLEAALHARTLGGSPLPEGIQRRGRARLLQRAAEMREAKRAPRRSWLVQFRPLVAAFLLLLIFISSTGLVRASSATLPGDSLYPIKRTWEDVRLLFTFEKVQRVNLEMEYETERLGEIGELLAEGRIEPISFSGYVTAQTDSQWTVSGIPVAITAQTVLPGEPVTVGTAVTVYGMTTLAGSVEAHSINTVPAGTPIPTPKPEKENENESEEGESRQETEPRASSNNEANDSGEDSESGEKSKVEGVIQSISGDVWIIDGQMVNVSGAEIIGTPAPGATVTIEGYVDANGVFVATKVILGNSGGSGSDETSDSSDGDSNDDKNDDSGNLDDSNDNDDSNNDSDSGGDDLPDNGD